MSRIRLAIFLLHLPTKNKDLRKEVETGANGTQDYVVKKGINKNTVATTRQ